MSAVDLGGMLRLANDVLPERVTYAGMHLAQVEYLGSKRNVEYGNPESYVWLVAAVMEEVESRDWQWVVTRINDQPGTGSPYSCGIYRSAMEADFVRGWGASPAHAMLHVLLACVTAIDPFSGDPQGPA